MHLCVCIPRGTRMVRNSCAEALRQGNCRTMWLTSLPPASFLPHGARCVCVSEKTRGPRLQDRYSVKYIIQVSFSILREGRTLYLYKQYQLFHTLATSWSFFMYICPFACDGFAGSSDPEHTRTRTRIQCLPDVLRPIGGRLLI